MERALVVVGAGVFGAALARHCARAGWRVTLVERVAPGHVRAGSGDESRLIRCAHGQDAWHAQLARRAWELWPQVGPGLLVPAGVVWLAHRDDGFEAASERALRALGIPCRRVDARELFPDVATDDVAWALLEPEAGVLRARDATRALAEQAADAGAEVILAEARPDGAGALLDDGRRLQADRVVWACGAWLAALFPGLADLRITRQDVFYFGAGARWRTPPVPAWVDYEAPAYGLGDLDGRGVKVCLDEDGPPFDAERDSRVPPDDSERRARAALGRRFPALAGAPVVSARVCQYELTADSAFLIAPHPDHDGRVWLMGGGSGHGFKHGPALAELMEGWLLGDAPPDPRFALGPRGAGRTLRTAGAR